MESKKQRMNTEPLKFRVEISKEVSLTQRDIIQKYWDYVIIPPEGDLSNVRKWRIKFTNSVKQILKDYSGEGLSSFDLRNLVKESSEGVLEVYCSGCRKYERLVFKSYTNVKEAVRLTLSKGRLCNACKVESQKRRESEERAKHEALKVMKERLLESQRVKRMVAVEQRLWEKLDDQSLMVLKRILSVRDMSEFWQFVFLGNPYDKNIWASLRTIERLGLITTSRGFRGKINSIAWEESLRKELILKEQLTDSRG